MKARTHLWAFLLAFAALGTFGCRRNIVRAAPASVAPTPEVQPEPTPEPVTPVAVAQPEPAPQPAPEPTPAAPVSKPTPPRPRPAPAEPEAAKPKEPEPEPPQISPQLTPQQQADAIRLTTDDLRTAEKNLQLAGGKQLNASQKDLAGKVTEFDKQAHEAIQTKDWVRAQSLARKAAILSDELLKSL